jgi:Outer membrane protein beta-barrel domain
MKATIFLVFALIFTGQVLFSQSNVSIGIIGGPTAANFWDVTNSSLEKKWMPAFSIGTAVRVNLKKHFFFQTDISYERKGFSLGELEWTDFNAIPIGKATIYNGFDYALLTPTIGLSTRGKIRFEGSVGIFGGYLTDVKSRFVLTTPNFPEPSITQSDANTFNRFDFGTTMRLGIGSDLGKRWSASLNAVGNLGFNKPYKPSIGAFSGYGSDKTASFGLQLGVFYKI